MKIINIDKERNEAIINYNGKEILSATIERFFFVKNKLHIKVKLPDWCCNGQYGLFDISDKFELLKKGADMKETKVYVDKLPKSCYICHCFDTSEAMCSITGTYTKFKQGRILEDCPLKSLHEHDQELVEKVLNRVKKELDGDYNQHRINYILDQIQKEVEDE